MGNACYYSFERILSSRLLSKKLKAKTYKTITLPVVLYGCGTWSLTLREEHRLRVFENKVFRNKYIYIYTVYIFIHIYIYIYGCVCMYVCVCVCGY